MFKNKMTQQSIHAHQYKIIPWLPVTSLLTMSLLMLIRNKNIFYLPDSGLRFATQAFIIMYIISIIMCLESWELLK